MLRLTCIPKSRNTGWKFFHVGKQAVGGKSRPGVHRHIVTSLSLLLVSPGLYETEAERNDLAFTGRRPRLLDWIERSQGS